MDSGTKVVSVKCVFAAVFGLPYLIEKILKIVWVFCPFCVLLYGEDIYRRYYYQQSIMQIASELSMTERAVEGKLYRIRKKLRDLIGGEDV